MAGLKLFAGIPKDAMARWSEMVDEKGARLGYPTLTEYLRINRLCYKAMFGPQPSTAAEMDEVIDFASRVASSTDKRTFDENLILDWDTRRKLSEESA
jgi:hypothetical protein